MTSNRANIDGTLNVLVAARDAGVKRLVFAGSSSAYGNTPTLPKHEEMPTRPLSPYALQKVVGEQYLQMFTRLYGLETVTIRYFNVFGPRQDPSSPYSGVISVFATALLENRSPMIYGDGEQTRDFTYVANVVDGVLRACEAPGASGEIINVATGGRISLNQLFTAMREVIGATVEPTYADARSRRRARLAGGHRQGAAVARLRADRHVRGGTAPDGRMVSLRAGADDRLGSNRVIGPSRRLLFGGLALSVLLLPMRASSAAPAADRLWFCPRARHARLPATLRKPWRLAACQTGHVGLQVLSTAHPDAARSHRRAE